MLTVHGSEGERLRVVDLERRRFCRETTDGLGERTRSGHPEVHPERVAVDPVFEEDEAVRVFDVVMYRVQDAARFQPGPAYVLEAESQHLRQRFGSGSHAARDDDHAVVLHRGADFVGPRADIPVRTAGIGESK
jgi:hypothetical protein